MTWSLTATGHCASEKEEAEVVKELREFLKGKMKDREVFQASVSTMFHGQQNLLKEEGEE